MWLLTVLLQGEATPTTLQFREENSAREAFHRAINPTMESDGDFPARFAQREVLTDDYGRVLAFAPSLFAKAILVSLDRAMAGDREVNLTASISNAMLQTEVMRHPQVKELQRATQPPPGGLMTPMAGGGFSPVRIG